MNRLSACLVAAALLLAPTVQAQTPPTASAAGIVVPPLKYETRTLANGLKVVTALDRSAPIATVQVFYGVGS